MCHTMTNTIDENDELAVLKHQERTAATRDSCRMRVMDLIGRNRDKFLTEREWFEWLNKQEPDMFRWSPEGDYIGYHEVVDLLRYMESHAKFIVNRNSMKDQVIKFLLKELERVGPLKLKDGRTVQEVRDKKEIPPTRWQRIKKGLTRRRKLA